MRLAKNGAFAFYCVAAAMLTVLAAVSLAGRETLWAQILLALLALFSLRAAVRAKRKPSYIDADAEGIHVFVLGKEYMYPWGDLQGFAVDHYRQNRLLIPVFHPEARARYAGQKRRECRFRFAHTAKHEAFLAQYVPVGVPEEATDDDA